MRRVHIEPFQLRKTEEHSEKSTSIILAQEIAGFRIDPMYPLTRRTDDCLKSMDVIAITFSVPLHIKAGMRAAENESGHLRLMHFLMTGALILNKFRPE
jgi:hypothetical protein